MWGWLFFVIVTFNLWTQPYSEVPGSLGGMGDVRFTAAICNYDGSLPGDNIIYHHEMLHQTATTAP